MITEFIFGNKAKSSLANMNSIQVTTQDLFRLHSGCHGDFIDVATNCWCILSQESFIANMNSIRLKTKELLRFHSGYHGDQVAWQQGILLMAIVSGNLDTKCELDMT